MGSQHHEHATNYDGHPESEILLAEYERLIGCCKGRDHTATMIHVKQDSCTFARVNGTGQRSAEQGVERPTECGHALIRQGTPVRFPAQLLTNRPPPPMPEETTTIMITTTTTTTTTTTSNDNNNILTIRTNKLVRSNNNLGGAPSQQTLRRHDDGLERRPQNAQKR